MEEPQPQQTGKPYEPNMFWEGYFYLAFFILFNVVVIPNMPKQYTFDRNYPIAMLFYGFAGVLTGIFIFRIVRKMPGYVKFAIIALVYLCIILFLFTHVQNFSRS